MFRFFRSIRQGLINEGKTSKYFRYAFGEILLIVVGIMIALQIQNWNEGRNERTKEIQIISSLHEDFEANIELLDTALINYAARNETNLTAITFIGKSKDVFKETFKDVEPLTIINSGYELTEIVDGTLSSVLSTDKLELLKDDSLKRLLTAYPASIKSFKLKEENLQKLILEIQRPLIESYVSLTDVLLPEGQEFQSIHLRAVRSDFEGLFNNLRYQNALLHRYWTSKDLSESAVDLRENTMEIFNKLNENLNSANARP